MLFEQIFNKTFILSERFFKYKHFYVIDFLEHLYYLKQKTYSNSPQHNFLI